MMTSPSSITHFDLDVIRSSLAETELKCALFRDIECHQRQFNKQPKKNNEPIMSLMKQSNELINKTFDHLKEKSDGSNEVVGSLHRHIHHNLPNGHTGKNGTTTIIDRAKPFVPPKQVLMYLVR